MAHSPDDVPESDPEADPEEDDDEDPEEDPIDYSADGGDDGDDEMDIEEDEDADMDIDEEDEDDEMDDEEAEEEHSAPAYPVVVALPATAPSAEGDEHLRADEPLPVPAWSDSEVARLLAISSPPASPLSPWSSSPPQIPLPVSPPPPVLTAPPPSPIRSLGYRAATSAAVRIDQLEVLEPDLRICLPLWVMLVRRDPERYVGYGITDSWDEIVETLQGAPVSTDTELGGREQLLAGRVNMLFRDRRTHALTRQLMETEAGMSREAWRRAMDSSDLAHGGVISLRTTVYAQMEEITELQSADPADCSDLDCGTDTTEGDGSTTGVVDNRKGQVTGLTGDRCMIIAGEQVTTLQDRPGTPGGLSRSSWLWIYGIYQYCDFLMIEENGTKKSRVSAALAARDATRNGLISHSSGNGLFRGSVRVARECALPGFHEMQPWADKIERYVRGLPGHDPWKHRASKPKDNAWAFEMATELMDKRVSTMAGKTEAENKRKV
ncbi:hypothetical protein Tco_0468199 [Tanacetum coccineum]